MSRADGPDARASGGGRLSARRLLVARTWVSVALAGVLYWWARHAPAGIRLDWLAEVMAAQMALLLAQWGVSRSRLNSEAQIGFQLLGDLLVMAALVYASGGADSPFALLFGLVIIAAGTQARPLLPVAAAVVACACHLATVYALAWRMRHPLDAHDALGVLLQVSVLLLVGGVMGGLARRQRVLMREEARARRLHRRLESLHGRIMDALHDGVLALDDAGRIVDANRAARIMLGQGMDLAGRRLEDLMDVPEALRAFMAGASGGARQCEWRRDDRIWVLGAARVSDAEGSAAWVLTAVDVTAMRLLERRLVEEERLAALGRMTAMLAHEIRNPLQSIGQAAELLASHEDPSLRREAGEILLHETARLERLVADLVNYARPLNPRPRFTFVRPLIEAAVAQARAESHGTRVEARMVCSDDDRAWVDADHLRLVLDHLLRNAMRVGRGRGRVEVDFEWLEPGRRWELRVRDDAGVLPEVARDSLFEPFASARMGGVGLGLATVWQVCRANGWEVDVSDAVWEDGGKGAVFMVRGGTPEDGHGDDPAG